MLTNLTVENYALIDRLEIRFDRHLNIITGETGAGKSILMGALGLLLGAKNDTGAIKDASRNCVIEGEFDIDGLALEEIFERNDIDYDAQTVIRRIISPSGKSRAYVNDQPVPLAFLKELCGYLIDIHSQHQNLIISSEQFRMKALDTVAECGALADEYRRTYAELSHLRAELAALKSQSARSRDDEQWLRHQVDELVSASLREGETEELEAEQRTLENADRIGETLCRIRQMLEDDADGILMQLKDAENSLRHIAANYAPATELAERLRSTAVELKDVDSTVADDADRIESDPERLDKVNERLDTLYTLCRKHRADTVTELIGIRDRYAAQLDAIVHGDEAIAEAERRTEECESRAKALADRLHDARAEAAPKFAGDVVGILAGVGMAESRMEIRLTPTALSANGCDTVDFMFSANADIEPRQIEKIASGGELSRVMLALKAILARRLALPTIIFDEIDTGVSGRIANAVGDIISTLSESMQVIDITHLPQVASKGDSHFLVYKSNSTTQIRELSAEERVEEIAKMLSGDTITEAALSQARILLDKKRTR